MQKVKKILAALQQHLNIKNYQLLAEHFDIKTTTVYSWVKNDNIANTGKILAKCPYLSIDWLETGEGPMINIERSNIDGIPSNYQGGQKTLEETYVKPNLVDISEPETKMVRMYRDLAQMDADTLREIQTWLKDMEKIKPGFTGWFRLEFQNRFPEFDEWKGKVIKKQANGDCY